MCEDGGVQSEVDPPSKDYIDVQCHNIVAKPNSAWTVNRVEQIGASFWAMIVQFSPLWQTTFSSARKWQNQYQYQYIGISVYRYISISVFDKC